MKKYLFTNQFLSKTKIKKTIQSSIENTIQQKKCQSVLPYNLPILEDLPSYLIPLSERPEKNIRIYFQNSNTLKLFLAKEGIINALEPLKLGQDQFIGLMEINKNMSDSIVQASIVDICC